jgi:hypothetical protein
MANVNPKSDSFPSEGEAVFLVLGSEGVWHTMSEKRLQERGNGGRPVYLVDVKARTVSEVDVLDYTEVSYVLAVQGLPGGSPMAPVGEQMVGMPGRPTQPVLRGDDDLPDEVDGGVAEAGSIFQRGSGE